MLLALVVGGAVGYIVYSLTKLILETYRLKFVAIISAVIASILSAVILDVILKDLHIGTEQLAKSAFQFSIWGGILGCFIAYQSWKAGKGA